MERWRPFLLPALALAILAALWLWQRALS